MAAGDVRVGFVGCGVHARERLLPAVQRVGMDLAAICDLDRRLAQRTTRRFGAFRAYQDARAMIDEMDLDAVLVCGPPELHAEAAETALAAGCHLWTEVPVAPNADEAEEIATIAEEHGRIAQAGLNARFAPAYQRMREIVDDPEFGELRSVEIAWWVPETHGHDNPVLFDLVHALDLVRHLGGDVVDLCVVRARQANTLAIALELQADAVATISFTGRALCPRERVEVASLDANVTTNGRQQVILHSSKREETAVWGYDAMRVRESEMQWEPTGHIAQLRHFAESVLGDTEPEATFTEAVAAMRLAERIAQIERS